MNRYIQGLQYQAPHPFRTNADRIAKMWDETQVDENGIITWKFNGHVPPKDVLEFWQHLGYEFDMEKALEEGEKQLKETIENYKKNYQGPSEEEKAEARAAHGPGVKLVNVITGDTWYT